MTEIKKSDKSIAILYLVVSILLIISGTISIVNSHHIKGFNFIPYMLQIILGITLLVTIKFFFANKPWARTMMQILSVLLIIQLNYSYLNDFITRKPPLAGLIVTIAIEMIYSAGFIWIFIKLRPESTPQEVQGINLKTPSLSIRFGAVMVDYFVVFLLGLLVGVTSKNVGLASVIALLFFIIKDSYHGASFGRKIFKIAIRDNDDNARIPKVWKLMIRNLLAYALWPIHLFIMVLDVQNRGLAEKVTGTKIVLVDTNV